MERSGRWWWAWVLVAALSGCSSSEKFEAAAPVTPAQRAQFDAYLAAADAIEAEAKGSDYERCLKHPDLPGNTWPAGAARLRCGLLREPELDLAGAEAMLARKGGAKRLDAHYAQVLQAHHRDPAQPEVLNVAYWIWNASPDAGRVALRWWRQSPDSPYAMAALGSHLVGLGLKTRGTRFASDTSDDQMQGMHEAFDRARPLLTRAHGLEPGLTPVCDDLYSIGEYTSDIQLSRAVVERCRATDPGSWEMLSSRQWQASRVSGFDRDLETSFAEIRALQARHPLLASLPVELDQMHAFRSATRREYAKYPGALERGALQRVHPGLIAQAGVRAHFQGDSARAEVFLTQALRFLPRDDYVLYHRAANRSVLKQPQRALADARRAVAVGGDDPALLRLVARLEKEQAPPAAQ